MNAVYYSQDEDLLSEASTVDAEEDQRVDDLIEELWELYVNGGDEAALDAMDGEQVDDLMEFYGL